MQSASTFLKKSTKGFWNQYADTALGKVYFFNMAPQLKVKSLSLTLRDAQHLSWKTFKKLESLNEKRSANLESGADLIKKSSAIAEKIKASEKTGTDSKDEVGKLLSELLFNAFVVAEHSKISLEETFLQNMDEVILGFVS